MRYDIVGNTNNKPTIAILTPKIQKEHVSKYYYEPHLKQLNENIMICDLHMHPNKKKKTPNKSIFWK